MNVPRLRFKEFSGAWEEQKLGDLCLTFKSGTGITSEQINNKGKYPVYGGNGLRGYADTFTHDGFFVLIGRQGALCGNINRSFGKSYISEHAIAVNANETSHTEWLAQKLDLLNLNRLSESSAQPGLAVNKLVKLKLVVPSKSEQTKIANFLTAVDEKIAQLTQKGDLLARYKKGVMQQIFSQQLRFKPALSEVEGDDDGREFPAWEEKTIGQIADVKGGKRLAKGYSLQNENNGIPYITVSDMYQGGVDIKNIRYVPSSIAESIKNYKISINDIFISVAGTLGIVGIVPKELDNANLTENANKLTNLKCNQQYLLQYLMSDSLEKLIDGVKTTNAQPKLAIYAINSFVIYLPSSISEQTKIANFLTALDDKISHNQTQLNALKQYKQGLLQQMFV